MIEKHLPDDKPINGAHPTSFGIGLGFLGRAIVCPIGFFACAYFTMGVTYRFTERVFLSALYGADRYAAGLRIVRKHYLTDGTRLPGWVEISQAVTAFMLMAPVIVTYMLSPSGWVCGQKRNRKNHDGKIIADERRLAEKLFL